MVCALWAAVLGSRTRVDADNRKFTNPLTGEPDAGNPPVRFGGRGKVNPLSLPLSPHPYRVARCCIADWQSAGCGNSKPACLSEHPQVANQQYSRVPLYSFSGVVHRLGKCL